MKSKALSILTSTALVLGPVGTTAMAAGSAFADDVTGDAPVYSDVLNGYPRQARLVIAQYQTGIITADQLKPMLAQLVSGGLLSETDSDRLILALSTGVFDSIPVVNYNQDAEADPLVAPEFDELEALIDEFEAAADAGLPLPNYLDEQDAAAEADPVAPSTGKGLIPIGGAANGGMSLMADGADPATAEIPDAETPSIDAGVIATPEVGTPAAPANEPVYTAPVTTAPTTTTDPTTVPGSTAQPSSRPTLTMPGASSTQGASDAEIQAEQIRNKMLVIPTGGSYTPVHYSTDSTVESFIATIGEQAREIAQKNNLYASVMIAQAVLESASGTSELAKAPNFNLFGIKGDYNGNSVRMLTQEDDGTGTRYSIRAAFRQYDSYQASLEDYADLLANGLHGFYHGAWKTEAATPAQACDYLQGRYATSTDYSANLQNVIATYNLTRFDNPLPYEPVDKIMVQSTSPLTGQPMFDQFGVPVMEERTLADLTSEAVSHLGVPYVWGGSNELSGFDCSGLVQHAYGKALGINLPRTTYYQWLVGADVAFNDLHPGDLLFFANGTDVHHVAIYLGDGYYIHAPRSGDVVRVTSMEEYMPTFAKRIVQTKPVGATAAIQIPSIEKQTVRIPNEYADEIDKQLQQIKTYSEEL